VYLKLDLLQQSGSFKDRGMAHLCATVHKVYNANHKMKQTDEAEDVVTRLRLISSSGGNAGLAVTTVAQRIPDMEVFVVVPETTKPLVIEKLRSLGAEVTVHGENWNIADALAREWVEEAKEKGVNAVYVRCVRFAYTSHQFCWHLVYLRYLFLTLNHFRCCNWTPANPTYATHVASILLSSCLPIALAFAGEIGHLSISQLAHTTILYCGQGILQLLMK
jgi:threonine synthase